METRLALTRCCIFYWTDEREIRLSGDTIGRRGMPTIRTFYGEFEATIDLHTPWAMIHREELIEDWRLCRENAVPAKIDPLT